MFSKALEQLKKAFAWLVVILALLIQPVMTAVLLLVLFVKFGWIVPIIAVLFSVACIIVLRLIHWAKETVDKGP